MKNSLKIMNITLFLFLSLVINAQTEIKKEDNLALHGYCPVAYAAMEKAVKGNPEFTSEYKGRKYNFAMEKAKTMFDENPDKFLPQYHGYCTSAIAMGKKVESNPEIFSIYEGKTYLFSNKMAKDMFDKKPGMTVKNADKNIQIIDQN